MEDFRTAPGDRAQAESEAVPFLLDGFDIAEIIGRGSFGVVYRARQLAFNRPVALKLLTARLDDPSLRHFEGECKAMGVLSGHPNIVTLYDSGVDDCGRAYLVMDLMTGGTLAELLRSGPLGWREVIDVGVKLAGALETSHRAGMLHGDVKPENILVSAYGEPKLGDFGIALAIDSEAARSATNRVTPLHAPPEVLQRKPPSERSDVYSLASTLFALMAGGPAFGGLEHDHFATLVRRVTEHEVPDLRHDGVPDLICAVVERGMSKDAAMRQCSAAAFGEDLRNVQRALHLVPTEMLLSDRSRTTADHHPPMEIDLRERDARSARAVERPAVRPPTATSSDGFHGLQIALPTDIRVTPGGEGAATVVVRNTGVVAETVEVTVQGLPEEWLTVEPSHLYLATRASSAAVIRVRPPRSSTTRPGPRPFDVSVWSSTNPNVRCSERRKLMVEAYVEATVSLKRSTSCRRRGMYTMTVSNNGNSTLVAGVQALERAGRLRIAIPSPTISVAPGDDTRLDIRAVPRRRLLVGRPVVHVLRAVVTPQAGEAVSAETTVSQRPAVPPWLQVVLVVFLLGGSIAGGLAWKEASVARATVPKLTGMTWEQAGARLKHDGFSDYEVVGDGSSGEQSGVVTGQSPPAGDQARLDRPVILTVSSSTASR